ncbi:MAG TPA: type IV secretion system DNA-binding domain-containing protein [Pyrinomonadaceae bacterium]|nr:type IV secretion system DNA-binding domain-containing protein [Pyrinomonadaceae bacterium]
MRGRLKPRRRLGRRLIARLRDYFGIDERPTWISIPCADETEHIMLLGDPGTGKSQTIHHFLLQIAARQPTEAAVVYDPACEFVKRHYNAARGDIILNPLDKRFPYWSPAAEVQIQTDKKLLAESFLPGKPEANQASTSGFFLKAARAIFGRILEFQPTPAEIVSWLKSEDAIDMIVAGTEHAHLIPKKAHGQRAGVLGVLSELGDPLHLLPQREACEREINLSQWTNRRQGWIFITSRMDTREALRPLQAAFINLLMKRLMSVSPEWGQVHPCWLIVDEVHSLQRLPALYETESEGRKYGIKLIQGTQGKTQYEEYYDRLAKAMLAAPKLKLFFRCGESESARWISDTIGEYEVEKPRIATTASVEDRGRDALNYSTTTEQRQAISKEEIMSLPDLHGYWKYGDVVVPFRLPLATVKIVTRGFIARELPPSQIDPKAFAEQHKRPHSNETNEVVAKTLQSPPDTRRHEHAIAANVIQHQLGADVATSSRYNAELPTPESQSTDLCSTIAADNDVDEFHYQQD